MTATHPDQLHDAFTKAVNSGDVEALVELYEPDGVAVGLDGSEISGAAGMRAMCEGLVASIRHIEGVDRKLFVAGDIALSSGVWTAEVTLPDGTVVTQQGTTCEVSRRRPDGTWAFVIDDPMFV